MYCTLDDLINQSSEAVLIKMTDDDDTGEINQTIVDRAIDDAQGEIESYCESRYALPFSPVPGIIRKVAVDIAIYNLLSRRGYDKDSEDQGIVQRYKDSIKFLQNLANGVVTVGPRVPSPNQPQTNTIKSSQRIFSRSRMEGF
ncbi:MAG: DUF1320 domain-containing protein [Negativicutes bacterium]|nr:DUF1320 domain-containing protein [Negativicutes bacterium]